MAHNTMRRITPVHQITPFTYRDGSSYLEVLNRLREYITQVAVPEVHRELNRIIGEFQEGLAEVERTRDSDINRFQKLFDEFMENVTRSLAGLNDEATAENILRASSHTWEALNTRFTSREVFNAANSRLSSSVRAVENTIDRIFEDEAGTYLRGEQGPRALTDPILLEGHENLDELEPDLYYVASQTVAGDIGLPVNRVGSLEVIKVAGTIRLQRFTTNRGPVTASGSSLPLEVWVRGMDADRNYLSWERARDRPQSLALVDDDDIDTLEPGLYHNSRASQGISRGLPVNRIGSLEVIAVTDTIRLQRFTTNRGPISEGGTDLALEVWVRGMDENRDYLPWEREKEESLPLVDDDDIDTLEPGLYHNSWASQGVSRGLPVNRIGSLEVIAVTDTIRLQRFTTNRGPISEGGTDLALEVWVRGMDENRNYLPWELTGHAPVPITDDMNIRRLEPGVYYNSWASQGISRGLPVNRIGSLEVIQVTGSQRLRRFTTNRGPIVENGVDWPLEVWISGMLPNGDYMPWELVSSTDPNTPRPSNVRPVQARHALSTGDDRQPVFAKNTNETDTPASTMKILTCHVARKFITNSRLDESVTVLSSDMDPGGSGSERPLYAGDIITYRDLFYGIMLPSHNYMAQILARAVGEELPGSGDPVDRFITEMVSTANEWEWEGVVIDNVHGRGYDNQLNVETLIDLLYEIADNDRWFMDVMGTRSRQISIGGPNARDMDLTHTINPAGAIPFPEYVAGKTGTLGSSGDPDAHACLAMLWRDGHGEIRASALIGSNRENRYKDMRQLINRVQERADSQYIVT